MSKDSKTPQAFPYSGEGDELNYSKGMTLRDYFAAEAMQGLIANNSTDAQEIAQAAYIVADAMLKRRQA